MSDEWTKVPNFFFEYMADMGDAERSVVLCVIRQTCGYKKEWDRISFSQFQKFTGIKHPLSVQRGIESAIKRGIIQRKGAKNSYEYRVCNPGEITSFSEVIIGEKPLEITSLNEVKNASLNEVKTKITSLSEVESLHLVKTQKKKENINNITDAKRKSVLAKNEETETPEHQQWFSAVCWLVHGHKDYKLLGKTEKLAIATTVKAIRDSGEHYTIDDLRTWYSSVWAKSWPGLQKNGVIQKPRLKDIKTGIGQVRTINQLPPQALNGTSNHTGMSVFDRDFQGSEA